MHTSTTYLAEPCLLSLLVAGPAFRPRPTWSEETTYQVKARRSCRTQAGKSDPGNEEGATHEMQPTTQEREDAFHETRKERCMRTCSEGRSSPLRMRSKSISATYLVLT